MSQSPPGPDTSSPADPHALEFLRQGQPSAPPPMVPVRAGPVQLLYDPATGFVRHVRLGDREVLRGIYAAVRDRNWGTVPGQLTEVRKQIDQDRFHIEFEAVHRLGDIHFVWRGTLSGAADGTLRYDLDGEATTSFQRNRIGFCVLHPIRECAGVRARQTRTDGRVLECRFPETIEPQIFGQASIRELRALAHEVEPGVWAWLTFEGDVFEMEDQRNWTDASFKTYCTPLALPFPVEVPAGARVRQSIRFHLESDRPLRVASGLEVDRQPAPITVQLPAEPAGRLPAIGLGTASHGQPLTTNEITRLRALTPAHLRVDMRLDAPAWAAAWDAATHRASELGLPIELALHLPREVAPNLDAVAVALRRTGVPLVRVLVLREGEIATRSPALALVRQHLAALDVPIGGGSDCNFCELNREQALGRFARVDSDFIFWPINPQVHAVDRLSLVESLEAQSDTVRSARSFAGHRPLVVSPVTLKQRFNPVATGPEPSPPPGELPPQVDARQLSLFGAGWTLGSVAALTRAGVESITYYETTGWRGVTETPEGARIPDRFPSRPLQVFPMYHVFAALAGCTRASAGLASDPLVLSALALLDRNDKVRLLMANLTDARRNVRLSGWPHPTARVQLLDESNVVAMTDCPDQFTRQSGRLLTPDAGTLDLDLPPFAFVRIDP